eukprot:55775-Hanusia_phi.AAC.2
MQQPQVRHRLPSRRSNLETFRQQLNSVLIPHRIASGLYRLRTGFKNFSSFLHSSQDQPGRALTLVVMLHLS